MKMFGKIVREVLIEKTFKELLNESQSISEDVIQATKETIEKIVSTIKRNSWNTKSNSGFNSMTFACKPIYTGSIFKNISFIQVTIINYLERDNYIKNYLEVDGHYNYNDKVIRLTLPFYNDRLDIKNSVNIIGHELTHLLQHTFNGVNDFKDLNNKAMSLSKKYEQESDVSDFLYIIYYLRKEEIDAKAQELAIDLNTCDIKTKEDAWQTPIYRYLYHVRDIKDASYNNRSVDKVIDEIGVDKEWLFNYLSNQIKYAENKYMRVVGGYLNGIKFDIFKEHKFKNINFIR